MNAAAIAAPSAGELKRAAATGDPAPHISCTVNV
jgi:hypothetical protein